VRDGKSSETKISGIEADFPTKFSPLVDIWDQESHKSSPIMNIYDHEIERCVGWANQKN
jgi:hypothetical protein